MDVAHPKVAAAVDDHSTFRTKPNLRAWSTADAAIRLVFGDAEVARAGRSPDLPRARPHQQPTTAPSGRPSPVGPALQRPRRRPAHVGVGHAWWTRPRSPSPVGSGLSPSRRRHGLLRGDGGIRPLLRHPGRTALPADRAEFAAYMEAMFDGGLEVDDRSREMARQILWFRPLARPASGGAGATTPGGAHPRPPAPRTLDIAVTRRDEQWPHAPRPLARRLLPAPARACAAAGPSSTWGCDDPPSGSRPGCVRCGRPTALRPSSRL